MCHLLFLHPTKARVSCLEDVPSRRRRELPAIQIWWPTQRHADVDWGIARLNPKLRHCKLDAHYIKSLRSMDFLHSLTLSRVNVEWFCKKCKYSKSSGEAIVTPNLLRYIHNFPTWSWLANYPLIETWTFIFHCPALAPVRDRYAQLFSCPSWSLRRFIWQDDQVAVVNFVFDACQARMAYRHAWLGLHFILILFLFFFFFWCYHRLLVCTFVDIS